MKKNILFFTILFFITCLAANGQSGVPQAMKYQAVARDKFGIELKNKKISLKVTLSTKKLSTPIIYYVEQHTIVTNEVGIFTIAIGEGAVLKGVFKNIPWPTDEIWMDVDIQEESWKPFVNISSSRLLTVPYAFHAETASHLTGVADGALSNIWSLKGNWNTNPETDKIGTNDNNDLRLVTNNKERLVIKADGKVDINGPLHVGDSLDVDGNFIAKKNVYLNTSSGVTIVNGDAAFQKQVVLNDASLQSFNTSSGALVVKGGAGVGKNLNVGGTTNLGDSLNVTGIATLNDGTESFDTHTGALVVTGGTGIGKNLNVGGKTHLGDSLMVTGNTLLNSNTESIDTNTGAMVVKGGVGIAKNLNVGGITHLGDSLYVKANTLINSNTESMDTSTGALVVKGGVGISKNLNIGGRLIVDSNIVFNNDAQSYNTSTGALILKGGAGIAKNVNIGQQLRVSDTTSLFNHLRVGTSADVVAKFINYRSGNGIDIQIGKLTPDNSNAFVTFKNALGEVVGQISGETLDELHNSVGYKDNIMAMDYSIALATMDQVFSDIDLGRAVAGVVAAATSSTACAGLGLCVTAPIASLIAEAAVDLGISTAQVVTTSISLQQAVDTKNKFIADTEASVGVSYQSGAGDYAEWLPKNSTNEKFIAGDIVGIKNGKITLNTVGATQIFVVSQKPIVLGNVPKKEYQDGYEKVAFMGQVSVKVIGKVAVGDYIVPNGYNDGYGKAVNPVEMKAADYGNIVGIAWSAKDNALGGMVNVAVGLNLNSVAIQIQKQENELKKMQYQIDVINNALNRIANLKNAPETNAFAQSHPRQLDQMLNIPSLDTKKGFDTVKISSLPQNIEMHAMPDRIVYFNIPDKLMEQGFEEAEKRAASSDTNNINPFWKRIKSDPRFKQEVMKKLKDKLNEEFIKHKVLESQYNEPAGALFLNKENK